MFENGWPSVKALLVPKVNCSKLKIKWNLMSTPIVAVLECWANHEVIFCKAQ
jgi:hypothetical protein